jgi:UDP-N-acetylmuramoyl-tripeptide--D-alanyl-D-alanine ligase
MSLKFSLAELTRLLNTPASKSITNETKETPDSLLQEVVGINTDTRSLQNGEVFVALVGENFDGHDYLETAAKNGAIAAIVSRAIEVSLPQILVGDTLDAYQKIGRWWRDRLNTPIVAITGSVGKTTTKELIAAVLGTQGNVLKTQANYNNEIGVPKTLLELRANHDFGIIEMGMRGRGEIALLAQIARPDIGVITNVGTAHIGRLGSEEAIAEAKCELLAEMPASSLAIINYDNLLLRETAARYWQGKTTSYGLTGGDLHGEIIDHKILRLEGKNYPLPLVGSHNASNYLAAIATAKAWGLDLAPLEAEIAVELPKGRARRYDLPNDITILDETYNAGTESMLAALHLLKETAGTRKIAVLGTMKELGDRSLELHYRVGAAVKQLGLDRLFVLTDDPEAEAIAQGAAGIPTECFTTHAALVTGLLETVTKGDRLLFKASNSVGLNRVMEEFKNSLIDREEETENKR